MKLNIVADQGLHGLEMLAQHQLSVIHGREIKPGDIEHADVLLVRSVTKVDEVLLQNARQLSFVGTATIGTDHIDLLALKRRDITFAYAPGCNANAVVDYVLAVLLDGFSERDLRTLTIGIAGYGNVGRRLSLALQTLGIPYQVYDPLLEQKNIPNACDARTFLASDIFSLHVPLSVDGPHPTLHWFSHDVFSTIAKARGLINTSRGEVIDQQALLKFLEASERNDFLLALDVWPREPEISTDLLSLCEIATPHIAGHSQAGKLRGSLAIFKAMAEHFKCGLDRTALTAAEESISSLSRQVPWSVSDLDDTCLPEFSEIQGHIRKNIDLKILTDDFSEAIRAGVTAGDVSQAFERFRRVYKPRSEFNYPY